MDAGNMLKPMLARGELHMIGATTLDEYRKHIETDAALERRFQPVLVDEPTVEDTISILRGLARAARDLPRREDPGRRAGRRRDPQPPLHHRPFLPDKAIDLVDEACARLRTEIDSMPAELDELTRRVTRLEIEEAALAKEDDPASKARLEELRRELADLRAEADAKRAQWEAERQAHPPGPGAARASSSGRARRPRRPSGATTSTAPPSCATARSPSSSGGWPPRRSSSPTSRAAAGCCARWSPRRRSPRSVAAWTGIPVSRLQEGERREAAAPRRDPARAGHRPGRGRAAGRRRDHPRPFRASRTRAGRSARSSSSARPASVRPSWPRRSPRRCSTPRRTWSGST